MVIAIGKPAEVQQFLILPRSPFSQPLTSCPQSDFSSDTGGISHVNTKDMSFGGSCSFGFTT